MIAISSVPVRTYSKFYDHRKKEYFVDFRELALILKLC